MTKGCEVKNENEVLICLEDFNEHIGKKVDEFEGVHGGFGIGKKNVEGRSKILAFQKNKCIKNYS